MKKHIFLLLVILSLAGTSCKNTLYVTGTPGTEIYTPSIDYHGNYKQLGEINERGELCLKLKKKGYYPFLLAKAENQENLIPFGTNIKRDKRYEAIWSLVILYPGTIVVPIFGACGSFCDKYFDYTPTSTNEDLFVPTKKNDQTDSIEIIRY